ncbi:antitoxin VapB family protein [Halocatena marina]|uniref:Antitoxin VapB family protein n=1 Tax=Halocatena marina TaxID=2934937 RepID=A0ABD5YNR7_9EURY|nr:antitoxin VapB family protein [Halocatena marina]
MGIANEQIRVSETVKHEINRRRREGESYNDVLERILAEEDTGNFYDGFGRWSNETAEHIREERRKAKETRKRRIRERAEETT